MSKYHAQEQLLSRVAVPTGSSPRREPRARERSENSSPALVLHLSAGRMTFIASSGSAFRGVTLVMPYYAHQVPDQPGKCERQAITSPLPGARWECHGFVHRRAPGSRRVRALRADETPSGSDKTRHAKGHGRGRARDSLGRLTGRAC